MENFNICLDAKGDITVSRHAQLIKHATCLARRKLYFIQNFAHGETSTTVLISQGLTLSHPITITVNHILTEFNRTRTTE